MSTRIAALLASAVVAAGVLVGQTPAYAVNLGTVKLSAQGGSVTANPIVSSGSTSAACPRGFGDNVQLRIGPPGGPFANIATPGRAGRYDAAPVTLRPNRSFSTALGAAPGDGEWWVVLECYSMAQGRYPDRFVTPIYVTGGSWQLTPPRGGPAALAATTPGNSGNSSDQRLSVTVTPSATPSSAPPSVGPSPGASGVPPAGAGSSGGGGGLAKTGLRIGLIVLLGLALISVGTWAVYAVRRRRAGLGSTGVAG
jgi:hypothetical protein